MGCASGYLAVLHGFIVVIGLAVTAAGIYLIVEGEQFLPETPESNGNFEWTLYGPLVFGILVTVLALLGCCCESFNKNKCFIFIFGILQFVFGIIIIAAGSLLIALTVEYLPNIANSNFPSLEVSTEGGQQEVSDFLLGLYSGCCGETINECPNTTNGENFCFVNLNVYTSGVDSGEASSSSYCALDEIQATCGDPGAFLQQNVEFLEDFVYPAAIAITVFGVLLFLAFLASCYLLCCASTEPKQPQRPKERTARDAAYGGGGPQQRGNHMQYA